MPTDEGLINVALQKILELWDSVFGAISFAGVGKVQLIIAAVFAFAPVLIWIHIIFRKGVGIRKNLVVLMFIMGVFSVVPLLALQYVWVFFPQWDLYRLIETGVANKTFGFVLTFMLVGITEEIVKWVGLLWIDHRYLGVKTVNQSLRYVTASALGFSFTENIFYFYTTLATGQFGSIFFIIMFRSVFTMAAHMIFSGIAGYYYGIGKYAKLIMEQKKWVGTRFPITEALGRFFGWNPKHVFRNSMRLKGLAIALTMHAIFNFLLQVGILIPVVIEVIIGFGIIWYLMTSKSGYLAYAQSGKAQASLMEETDEDVVLELVGMWFKEGRYHDVIEICNRLLQKDPDNKVVQLFLAKAMDKQKFERAMKGFGKLFGKEAPKKEQGLLQKLRETKGKGPEEKPPEEPPTEGSVFNLKKPDDS